MRTVSGVLAYSETPRVNPNHRESNRVPQCWIVGHGHPDFRRNTGLVLVKKYSRKFMHQFEGFR